MLVAEIISYQPTKEEAWAQCNLQEITQELEEGRASVYRGKIELEDYVGAQAYAPDRRALCVTAVCRALRRIDPPHGYKREEGRVAWKSCGQIYDTSHTYFVGKEDENEILCLTVGQFIMPDELDTVPNQRINLMKEKAPNLLLTISEDLTILHGSRSEIRSRLGLVYRPEKN